MPRFSRLRPYGGLRRLLSILVGQRAGGRVLPAALQLGLIAAWHPAVFYAQTWLYPLYDSAQRFWFRQGVTSGFAHDVSVVRHASPPLASSAFFWEEIVPYLVPILCEALLGWLGFRLLVRRPRPRWYRFIRFWWASCLYATLVGGVFVTGLTLLPRTDFALTMGSPLGIVCVIGAWFFLMPAFLARREVSIRARRTAPLCPVCNYWLCNWSGRICPECGSLLHRSDKGGYHLGERRSRPHGNACVMWLTRLWRWRGGPMVVTMSIAVGLLLSLLTMSLVAHPSARRAETVLVHTTGGPAEYSMCLICNSVRLKFPDGAIKYDLATAKSARCNHMWTGAIAAWSRRGVSAGDVILIRKSGKYSALKVISANWSTNAVQFEWFHQPDRTKGTFTDEGVQKGQRKIAGRIAFKDIDIQTQGGRVWYDFYYAGIDGATPHYNDPHQIAFAGKVDIAKIDAADPGWIYKTWEDGKPNGYGRIQD